MWNTIILLLLLLLLLLYETCPEVRQSTNRQEAMWQNAFRNTVLTRTISSFLSLSVSLFLILNYGMLL
jgi:hypothetical protein